MIPARMFLIFIFECYEHGVFMGFSVFGLTEKMAEKHTGSGLTGFAI